MAPSTIRTVTLNGFASTSWQRAVDDLEKLQRPFFAHAREHIVNSPDTHTGIYYGYNPIRTLRLTGFQDRAAEQPGGARGAIGRGSRRVDYQEDDDWTYLYTGRMRTSWFGLGWFDTFIYYSRSTASCFEGHRALARFPVFRWVRAGWEDVTFVRSRHISDRLQRYARAFKSIVEHPISAGQGSLLTRFRVIRPLPKARHSEFADSFVGLTRQSSSHSADIQTHEDALTLLQDRLHPSELQHEELRAIVSLEVPNAPMGRGGFAPAASSAISPRGLPR